MQSSNNPKSVPNDMKNDVKHDSTEPCFLVAIDCLICIGCMTENRQNKLFTIVKFDILTERQ